MTRASATVGAKSLGQDIPGNMVVGVCAPQFAIRLLEASLAAGIEAPLRLYITENPDGTATLSYKTAGHVLAPYAEEAEAMCDQIAIIQHGKIVAAGTVSDVRRQHKAGDASLEELFLKLTGGAQIRELAEVLGR